MSETRPAILVLASTYPRWKEDHEPAFVHELCKRLTEHFSVVVITPGVPEAASREIMDGVEVVRYAYAPARWQTLSHNGGITANLRRYKWKWILVPSFLFAQYLAGRRVLRERRIDAIHAHWLVPQGLVAYRLLRDFGVPYVITSHGGDLFGLRNRLLVRLKRRVANDCAAMTVVSSAMQEEAIRIALRPPRLEVLPMGVDLQRRFTPDATMERARNELLFVGRLVPKKGLRYLLEALPNVLAIKPDTRLTIAGFGPEEEALKAQTQHLGISNSVTFLGAKASEELPALYRRASIFVSPFVRDESGDQEGLPVALMEAIGCGCPPLVGEVAGIGDLLGEAAADICIDPVDTTGFAAAIVSRLENLDELRTQVIVLRQRILDKVDWRRVSAAYADVLSSSMRNPRN